MLFGSDTLSLGYMAREFYANAVTGGEFPFWNPVILGGTPFIESLAGGDSLYPPSAILLLLLDTHRALGWKLIWHVFFAGIFTYGWIRCLGLSKTSAFFKRDLVGIQPQFRHVPPKPPSWEPLSTHATLRPSWAARIAHT